MSNWLHTRERGTPWTIALMIALCRRRYRWLVNLLLYPIVGYFYLTGRQAHRASREFFRHASGRSRASDYYRQLLCFSRCLVDRVTLLSGDTGRFQVQPNGREALLAARQSGRGLILLGSHLGNFEAAKLLASDRMQLDIHIVAWFAGSNKIRQAPDTINPALKPNFIDPTDPDAVFRMRDVIAASGVLAILADRTGIGDKRAPVHFLGQPAWLPTAPWYLAAIDHPGDGLRNAIQRTAKHYGRQRIGIIIGTSTSGIYQTENAYRQLIEQSRLPASFSLPEQHAWVATTHFLQAELDLQGPCYAISTACSSSSKALAAAQRLIATGVCDAVLCGGVDSLCRMILHGFNSLDILSAQPSAPLDQHRSGISLGEAAGLLLLERPHRDNTDAPHLLSCGESSDAHPMTAPHPQGKGAAIAMCAALHQARLQPADIDYLNLHATGTRLNDQSEMLALQQIFQQPPPCSGTKGLTGHTLGAAGGTEPSSAGSASSTNSAPAPADCKPWTRHSRPRSCNTANSTYPSAI